MIDDDADDDDDGDDDDNDDVSFLSDLIEYNTIQYNAVFESGIRCICIESRWLFRL